MKEFLTEKNLAIVIIGTIVSVGMFKVPEPENIVINGLVAIAGLITGEALAKK